LERRLLELRLLNFEGLKFLVEAYSDKKHVFLGHKSVPIWIIIRGLPYMFFKHRIG
jgi:hypothetical protein